MKLPTEIWMCENEQARWFEFEQPHDLPNDVTVTKMVAAQPEQEPVAWMIWLEGNAGMFSIKREAKIEFARRNEAYPDNGRKLIPLYTTPPQRKPLTDEQIVAKALHLSGLGTHPDVLQFARAIEAAHGIKE